MSDSQGLPQTYWFRNSGNGIQKYMVAYASSDLELDLKLYFILKAGIVYICV